MTLVNLGAREDARIRKRSENFSLVLAELGDEFHQLVVLCADTAERSGAHCFAVSHPARFFQFSHAEQSMLAAAVGMSAVGMLPVITTFSEAGMRALALALHGHAMTRPNIKIFGVQAFADAESEDRVIFTQADYSIFRAVEGMTVISPADHEQTVRAIRRALALNGPVYVRACLERTPHACRGGFEIGKGVIEREGTDVTIIGCGTQVARALEAAETLDCDGISACVVNMVTIEPLDKDMLAACARATGAIVTVEDHSVVGGLGGAVAEALVTSFPCSMEFVGGTERASHGSVARWKSGQPGATSERIVAAATRAIARRGSLGCLHRH